MSGSDAGPPAPPGIRLAELEEIEVEVEKLVTGGEGLARFEGVPVFVPRSAPGDRLRVRLTERRPSYGRGEIVEVLRPGPDRREPPCPHFERCGGCDLQHLEDAAQVRAKALAVRETLQRLGGIEVPGERVRIVAGSPWAYRLRTQLHTRPAGDGTEVGYFARGSHDLVPVSSCPILVPELEELLPGLPRRLPDDPPRRLDLAAGDPGEITASPPVADLPHGEVSLRVGDHTYSFDARCFFQAHRGLVGRLVEEAVGEWEGETAVDLYAGVGLFSLPLARRYAAVTAVEGDRQAARYARLNARRNRLPHLEVECRSLEGWIERLPERPDRIVIDPPRRGLPRVVGAAIARRGGPRLTYVSCDAATLARDLQRFSEVYRLERLAILDLFPQSGHMEMVAQLARR